MKYHQQFNYRRRQRFIRRIKIGAFFFVLIVLGFVGWIYYDNMKSGDYNAPEQSTSAPTSSYVAPNIQIFRTPYFQFQTTKSWSEDPDASTANKFVYRSLRAGLLEQQLIVYVNAPPSDAVTRVAVVEPTPNRGLKYLKLSDHCGKASNFKDSSQIIKVEGVTLNCFGDDTRFTVLAGISGANTNMSLSRPDNTLATYTISYSNVTSSPDAIQLEGIINSFQTR